MDADRQKSKQTLIEELQALRQEAIRVENLQEQLAEMKRQQRLLHRQLDERCRDIETECTEKDRAGHEPAWLYDPDSDSFEELMGPGMALGIDDGFVYQSSSKSGLNTGQVIALGTDGIWEGRNTAGEMFGKSRFQEVIRRHADADAEAILDAVFQEHARFTRGTRAEDDITLVIIKLVR